MVMHARKVARLDDGLRYFYRYRDLNQPEILPKDKGLSNSHSTKYTDRKVSKFDSFDHRRHSNSPRSFHSRSGHYDNKPRVERRNYEEIDNRDSKTKEQKHKEHKSEVHRLAERVCGDWSEHISKSGKRYFYNCRTEVSQWEKPDCWIEENSTSTRNSDKVQHDASDRSKSSSSSKANSHGESRHSVGNNNTSKTSSTSKSTSRKEVRGTFKEEQRSPQKNVSSVPASKDVNSTSFRDRTSRQDRKRPYSRRSTSRSPAHSQKSGKYGSRGSSSELGSSGCYKNSSGGRNDFSAGNGGTVRKRDDGTIDSAEFESSKVQTDSKEAFDSHKNSPVHEDMDISPDNSFSQTEVDDRTSHDGLNSKSSPQTSAVTSTPTIPSGINAVASNNGEIGAQQSEQPSLVSARVPPSSKQEPSFPPTTSAPGMVSSNATSAWSGSNSSNLQQQQSLQTTLAGLEQAVLRLNPDKMSVSGQQNQSNSQANFASCLALLPVLLTQLSNQAGPGGNNSDNQLIIQQVIPLLKKLQEIVVHQQQQQQQMKLQQAIIQLLQMQNLGGTGVHASAGHKTPGNDKAESPYSPPDSDGSPVQTPSHNRHYPHHHHNRQPAQGNRQSPRQHQYHQESSLQVPVSKPNRQEKLVLHQTSVDESDERADSVPFNAGLHSKIERNHARPSVNSQLSTSSAGSQTPSHHPSVPFYRKNDIELTPSLVNHFNPNIIDHVTNWQADTLVKQADCIAADNYSYLGPLCSQVSVELKQARSMVRTQEILSTRNEQRRIFIQHQLYELDKDLPVPSFLPQNPVVLTFLQQQPSTHAPSVPQQQIAVPHQHSGPVTQPNPVPTPLSPQITPAQLPLPANPSSPVPPQDVPSASHGTPVATVTPCESSGADLT